MGSIGGSAAIGSLFGDSIGGITGAKQAAKGQARAADIQAGAERESYDTFQQQIDKLNELFNPYTQVGTDALQAQRDLAGLGDPNAQSAAIQQIQNSPQFTSLLQQGENSILSNAAATGGLRGGNTQRALSEFSPQLLSQLIDQQYSRLGGLTSIGQQSAFTQGQAGIQNAGALNQYRQNEAAALAGKEIAKGNVVRNTFGDLLNVASVATGAGSNKKF